MLVLIALSIKGCHSCQLKPIEGWCIGHKTALLEESYFKEYKFPLLPCSSNWQSSCDKIVSQVYAPQIITTSGFNEVSTSLKAGTEAINESLLGFFYSCLQEFGKNCKKKQNPKKILSL